MTIAALLALAACTAAQEPYGEEIARWRADKDAFMQRSPNSPVQPERRGSFAPLLYYAIDETYRVPAGLKVVQSDIVIEMPTSTGDRRRMRRIGTLGFTLQGQTLSLTAFVDATENDMRRLFVPFADETSGKETYAGGRYLDLTRTATGIYDLDFNRAYFPFCYYNPTYDCPLPPKENRLPLEVKAGERMAAAR